MSQLIIWGWKANPRSQAGPVSVAELQRSCVQVQKVHCPCCTSLSFQCPDGRLASGNDARIWSDQHGIEPLKCIQSIDTVLLLFIVVFPFYCLHMYEFQMISSPQLRWDWPTVTNPKGCQCQSLCLSVLEGQCYNVFLYILINMLLPSRQHLRENMLRLVVTIKPLFVCKIDEILNAVIWQFLILCSCLSHVSIFSWSAMLWWARH